MNAHQRRIAARRYERSRQMRAVPFALIEEAIDTHGGLERVEAKLSEAGIRADLRGFKIDLDGWEHWIPATATVANSPRAERCKPAALAYLVWRRNRAQEVS